MINKNLKEIFYFLKYFKPYWKKGLVLWLITLALVPLSLINPYLAKLVIDKAYTLKDFNLFLKLLILGGVVFVITNILTAISQYLSQYINIRIRLELQKNIFQKIENLPYGFFQGKPSGEYLYKLVYDSAQVVPFLIHFIPELFNVIPRFLLIMAILLVLNWKMAIFLFIMASFLNLAPFFIIRKINKKNEELSESAQDIMELAREIFSNMQLVKVFAKEKTESKRYIGSMIKNIRINLAGFKLNMLVFFLDTGLNKILFGLITLYGGYNIIKGQMTLGSFTAIMMYVSQLFSLQGSLSGIFVNFSAGNAPLRRLLTTLESWPKENEKSQVKDFLFTCGEIEFIDVNFGYYPERPILEHLSFKIDGATTIGLAGRSGSGKTTLTNLLVKLYPISNGRILIDKQDISLIKNKSLREQVGIALQKPILWNDTIRNNISFARPKASSEEISYASRISCAYDFIKDLPQGFDTVVGEAGLRLSEGQKQRLAIARAIIKRPKILIIDEGMSSLDSQTEDKIIDNLKRELKNTTIIVVSHRLSTIKKMDLVYFLEWSGKISKGYHKELVKENISYRELFASQIEDEKSAPSYFNKDAIGE